VELTLKQFSETLARFGVKSVASLGKAFDPACHQAVTRIESDTAPENIVMEEFQKGYRLHDRILRAAMVAISGRPAKKGSEEPPPDESS
jgi:molecular chaperone GrpE